MKRQQQQKYGMVSVTNVKIGGWGWVLTGLVRVFVTFAFWIAAGDDVYTSHFAAYAICCLVFFIVLMFILPP